MLCGSAWFSVMGLLAHQAQSHNIDWQVVAASRSLLALLIALGMAWAMGVRLVFLTPGVLWMRSIAGSCSMVATFYALTHMPASEALTLTNTTPIWVAILSWPMLGIRPGWETIVSVPIAVLGVAVMHRTEIHGLPLAAWSALVAAFFTALAMLGLNQLKNVASVAIVVHFSFVSTLFCTAAYFLFEREFGIRNTPMDSSLLLLLGVGITATAGQLFLTLAFRSGVATYVSLVGLSQVVMVMIAESVLGLHQFDWFSILGMVMILGPAGWLMVRTKQRQRREALAHIADPE